MKLHNLLLTAALLLTAGTVFAKKPVEEKDLEQTKISTVSTKDFTWTASEKVKTVTVNLKYDGQNGFVYAVFDASIAEDLEKDSLTKTLNKKNIEAVEKKYAGKIWFLKAGDNEITLNGVRKLGVLSNSPHTTFSVDNPDDDFLFYQQGVLVSENKVSFAGNKVSYGKNPEQYGKGNHAADITFGAPLPTPVVTLLIALAFGAGFVMYRNRKQAKA